MTIQKNNCFFFSIGTIKLNTQYQWNCFVETYLYDNKYKIVCEHKFILKGGGKMN